MFRLVLRCTIIALAFMIQFFLIPLSKAEDADFFANRGLRYLKEKKYYEALADLKMVEGKATEDRIMLGHSQPLPPFVHSSIIEAYLALGEYHSAGLFLGDGRWFVENENASFGFNTNAIVYLGMKDFAKAMANCKEAIRRKPDFAVAYSTCGSIARELGNLRQAVSFYDEAIRLQPSFVNAWAGRGVSNARQGELDRATIDCDRALQLNSKYSYAYYCRGLIAEAKGTLLLAAREFETALSIEPAETLYLQAWSRATKAPISHEKRVALVIGNADYKSAPLRSPVRDADAVAAALEKVGFKVIKGANANRRTMSLMLEEFWDNTYEADVALVYFSGHGGEYKGQNYLIPIDDAADDSAFVSHAFKEDVFKNKYIDLQEWVAGLRIKEPGDKRTRILIVDACRTPGGFAEWDKRGVVPEGYPYATDGMFIAYASSLDKFSYDGGTTGVTEFTQALVDNLTRKGVELRDLFKTVQERTAAGNLETPQSIDKMSHKFYFYPPDVTFPLADTTP